MDPPYSSTETNALNSESHNVKDMSAKERNAFQRSPVPFSCDNYDIEEIRRISDALISGLAAVCVENTYGDPFKSPKSVAVTMRKEMVEYLRQESATYPTVFAMNSECEGSPENPADVVDDLIENFVESKRNLFTRVSGWLLSEQREEKIDDFEEDLEISEFWPMARRERIVKDLVKNIDLRNVYHCGMKFDSFEDLEWHKKRCPLRRTQCENEGCTEVISAADAEKHDAICPLKLIPCEQKCPAIIIRDEMDRHCLTECPMRLVNCPFYQAGCQTTISQVSIEEHCVDHLQSHLLYVLQTLHKEDSLAGLTRRAMLLEKALTPIKKHEIQDVRSLHLAIKENELNIKALEINDSAEGSIETDANIIHGH